MNEIIKKLENLENEILQLKISNKELKLEINNLNNKIGVNSSKSKSNNDVNCDENLVVWSSLFNNNNTAQLESNKELEIKLINAVSIENQLVEKNLIIYGVKESINSNQNKCDEDDNLKIHKLFSEIKINREINYKFRRAKKKSNDNKNPMPIIIEFENKRDVFSVLKAAKNLKTINSKSENKICIGKDMTIAQRDQNKNLVFQRDQLNSKLEKTSKLRYGIRENGLKKIFITR